jgi:hypothetical protein
VRDRAGDHADRHERHIEQHPDQKCARHLIRRRVVVPVIMPGMVMAIVVVPGVIVTIVSVPHTYIVPHRGQPRQRAPRVWFKTVP